MIPVLLIVWGTFKLSQSVFDQSIKQLVNISYDNLPSYFKAIIFLFYGKKKYRGPTKLVSELYPVRGENLHHLTGPFWGFLLIAVGTLWAAFL